MFKPMISSTFTKTALMSTNHALLARSLTRPAAIIPSRFFQTNSTLTASRPDLQTMPVDMIEEIRHSKPMPMRTELASGKEITTDLLEKLDVGEKKHRVPITWSDAAAYHTVQVLRYLPDTYFRHNHYMRVVMLETVAAVPGMVGGMLRHLKSLRNIKHDGGWIIHLLHEAENERMHLLTWMKLLQPSKFDRFIVMAVQGIFFNAYFIAYLISPRTAHRFCGYLEEQAVISYTHFIEDIDKGLIKNEPAPRIAKGTFHPSSSSFHPHCYPIHRHANIPSCLPIAPEYYNLHPDATVRDVVLAVRSDEALHRDSNHHMSDRIAAHQEDLREDVRKIIADPSWKENFGTYSNDADVKWK
ncbi:alternative oxidase-domain-containing protein [Jimgerdemannia flammicorona]|uniref:Alternative oxidase n=1 Tax=Jimgerdemannia flammicorona TaxID=994334 RepID=A0A433QD45_9FUNG|nr:alternative oxidase-domain-containing protein [Jimgerdemannia flammicorona]